MKKTVFVFVALFATLCLNAQEESLAIVSEENGFG